MSRMPCGRSFRPPLRALANAGLKAIVPCRLGQQPARMAIARLGDTAATHSLARGMLTRHQAQIGHQLPGMCETTDVADFSYQANSTDLIDTTQRLQSLHHRFEPPTTDRPGQCLRHAL